MAKIFWPRQSLRVEDEAIFPEVTSVRSPNGRTRIYLLVHGFNNDPAEAEASYRAFRERIRDIIGLYSLQHIWEFYWPGYEEVVSEPLRRYWLAGAAKRTYTALCYFRQVPKAIRFGALLGTYLLRLRARTQMTEVVLIGHSLGCRLILEALAHIQSKAPRSKIPAILLMAGAVPVQHLAASGSLREAAQFPLHRVALHSRRDSVLRFAFPAGQILARDGGVRPEAAGLYGNPRECWTARDPTMLGHGGYWSDPRTTPNVVRLFGKATAHALPYAEIVPRKLPDPPPLPEWRSPERRVGT